MLTVWQSNNWYARSLAKAFRSMDAQTKALLDPADLAIAEAAAQHVGQIEDRIQAELDVLDMTVDEQAWYYKTRYDQLISQPSADLEDLQVLADQKRAEEMARLSHGAVIEISPEMLVGLLQIPPEYEVIDMGANSYPDKERGFWVRVVHPDLPSVREGVRMPSLDGMMTLRLDDLPTEPADPDKPPAEGMTRFTHIDWAMPEPRETAHGAT